MRVDSLLAAVGLATGLCCGVVRAQEHKPLSAAIQKYFQGVRTEGTFQGRLICAGEDLLQQKLPGCERGEHDALLLMEGDMIAHLIGATPAIEQRIKSAALHEKEVTVSGTYAEPWCTIFVREIHERQQRPAHATP
ncbi:MAG: hypothetical protein ACE5I7_00270 [Candidatus Binatia bacterium]